MKLMKKVLPLILIAALMLGLCSVCFADNFVPSIDVKTAPGIVYANESKGYIAEIVSDDDLIAGVPAGDFYVTSYADVNTATLEKVKTNLKEAYSEISTKALSEICPALDGAAKKIDASYNADDFVVTDLFDVTITDGYNNTLNSSDSYTIRIKFNRKAEKGNFVAMHKSNGSWKIVDDANVNIGDSEVAIKFDSLCAIAFLTIPTSVDIDKPEVVSPQTGENSFPYIPVIAASAVLLLGGAVILGKKKTNN